MGRINFFRSWFSGDIEGNKGEAGYKSIFTIWENYDGGDALDPEPEVRIRQEKKLCMVLDFG